MKILNKFKFAAIPAFMMLLLVGVTSCEDVIERDPSPAYNTASTNVYFASTNSSSVTIGLEDDTFDIVIKRQISTAAQTVALKLESSLGEFFTIPESVSFNAGEAEKAITVTVGDIEPMKKYHFAIEIDGQQTKPYNSQNVYPRIELNILREDFVPYAEGTYYDYFFAPGDDYISWPQVLEYSELTDTYRLSDVWVEGYDVLFKWTGNSTVTMVGTEDEDFIVIPTGYVHPSYGMVSAYYSNVTYDSATKMFTFPIQWTVSAGYWGPWADYYEITSVL